MGCESCLRSSEMKSHGSLEIDDMNGEETVYEIPFSLYHIVAPLFKDVWIDKALIDAVFEGKDLELCKGTWCASGDSRGAAPTQAGDFMGP